MKLDNEHDLNKRENGKVLEKIIISIIIIFILFILFIISYFILNDIRLNQEKENVGKRAEQIATEKLKEKYSERSFEIIGTNVYVHPASFGSSAYVDRSHVIVHIKENNEEYSVAVNVGSETISSDNIQEKENLKNQAEQIATAKLKEKYPERNFEITDIIVTERVSYDVALDKNEIIVYIKDNYNNEKYTVIVNCENGKISDNIQANEITEAIKEKLNEIIKIDSDTIEFDVWTWENYYDNNNELLCFDNKFNGDIIDFLNSVNEYNLYKMAICILYRNGEELFYINENNEQFLQLFESILLIDYKDVKPSYPPKLLFYYDSYDSPKYEYMQKEKRTAQQGVNEFYVYDENIHNFKKILE